VFKAVGNCWFYIHMPLMGPPTCEQVYSRHTCLQSMLFTFRVTTAAGASSATLALWTVWGHV